MAEFSQLDIFSYMTSQKMKSNSDITIKVSTQKKKDVSQKVKNKKPELPEFLKQLNFKIMNKIPGQDKLSFKEVAKLLNFEEVAIERYNNPPHFDVCDKNILTYSSSTNNRYAYFTGNKKAKVYNSTIIYVDKDGTVWKSILTIELADYMNSRWWGNHYYYDNIEIINISISDWKVSNRLISGAFCIQTDNELELILQNINPYALDFCKKERCDLENYFMAPQLEMLFKAGYTFAGGYFSTNEKDRIAIDIFNRLCQPGNNPKEIFKTSKAVYSVLKEETNMYMWDAYRKLDKFGRIKPDVIKEAYGLGYNEKDLESINQILAKKYNNIPIFTWETLVNYLGRLDMYEAIERREAFMLLKDYLSMCNQLEIKPKIDGDSLKREHDVVARIIRQKRDEERAKKMIKACGPMQKYNYEESIYFIRAIKDYDDLIDEAQQQHNCVASYADNIIKGKSYIYVMREVSNPEESLVTVELSPDGKNIRQKFLAYNKPIRNKSQTEFLQRWNNYTRNIKEKGVSCISNNEKIA